MIIVPKCKIYTFFSTFVQQAFILDEVSVGFLSIVKGKDNMWSDS